MVSCRPIRLNCRACTKVFQALRLIALLGFIENAHTTCLGVSFFGNASLEIDDPNGALSWNEHINALTVQAWIKPSILPGMTINDDMVILADRRTGSCLDPYAYLLFFDYESGHIMFSARGTSEIPFSDTLISQPCINHWYHVAVVREGDLFTGYLNGSMVFSSSAKIGNSANTDGVSIGGLGNSKYFYGIIEEVAVFQCAQSSKLIVNNMFGDQPALSTLRGYYKLSSTSTDPVDHLKNFALVPQSQGIEHASENNPGLITFTTARHPSQRSFLDAQKASPAVMMNHFLTGDRNPFSAHTSALEIFLNGNDLFLGLIPPSSRETFAVESSTDLSYWDTFLLHSELIMPLPPSPPLIFVEKLTGATTKNDIRIIPTTISRDTYRFYRISSPNNQQ